MNIPEPVRAYIYRVVTALAVVAVARGWVTSDEMASWLDVVVAVLAIGTPALAAVNTSTKKNDNPGGN